MRTRRIKRKKKRIDNGEYAVSKTLLFYIQEGADYWWNYSTG